jgi:hypothetical protein
MPLTPSASKPSADAISRLSTAAMAVDPTFPSEFRATDLDALIVNVSTKLCPEFRGRPGQVLT